MRLKHSLSSPEAAGSRRVYELGPFRLDADARELSLDGQPVPLTLKAASLLLVLVENRGHLVDKQTLLSRVWGDAYVGDGVLSVNVFALRRALAAGGGGERWIETLPRRGYRFTGEVRERWVQTPSASRAVAGELPRSAEVIRSIAVLPFAVLRGDGADDYLGLGIADMLITRLSKVRRLVVRPTSAVRGFTSLEQDAAGAAQALQVDAVLEGSIRLAGGRIRVLIQLIDGRRSATLWAGQIDEAAFTDIFAVEDRIAERVVAALAAADEDGETGPLHRRGTEDPEAYRLYLQGRYFWNRRNAEDLARGVDHFRRAIARDPRFALAWAGLADSYLLGARAKSAAEAMPDAKAAVVRALELDELSGEAHTSLGRIRMCFDWDWSGAREAFERALALAPNYPTAHQWYANYLIATGQTTAASAHARLACELEPCTPILQAARGWVCHMGRQPAAAVEHYRRALEMDPQLPQVLRELAIALEQTGQLDEGLAAAREAVRLDGGTPISRGVLGHLQATAGRTREARASIAALREQRSGVYVPAQMIAVIHAALGEREQALEWLERAHEERSATLVWLKVDPWVDGLRGEPRFAALLERLGLAGRAAETE